MKYQMVQNTYGLVIEIFLSLVKTLNFFTFRRNTKIMKIKESVGKKTGHKVDEGKRSWSSFR